MQKITNRPVDGNMGLILWKKSLFSVQNNIHLIITVILTFYFLFLF